MTEQIEKTALLSQMRIGYTTFVEQLTVLSTEQLTTPGVNGSWSIKDNLAHLTAWQRRTMTSLDAVKNKTSAPVDFLPGLSEDETNEHFYQLNRERPLADVFAEFQTISQQLIARVEEMSNEDLNKTLSWRDNQPIWPLIAGNTYEHFQEHLLFIKDWLVHTDS